MLVFTFECDKLYTVKVFYAENVTSNILFYSFFIWLFPIIS